MQGFPSDSPLIPSGMRDENGLLKCSRVCALRDDGRLVSPFQETLWESSVMRAHTVDPDKFVTGCAGLHAVWRLPKARPGVAGEAVLHCLADGIAAISSTGLRAEWMIVQTIILHPEDRPLRSLVQAAYPEVRVRVARPAKRCIVLYCGGSHGPTVNGLKHGIWHESDGSALRYRDGRPHGTWRYPDGSTIRYRNGRAHGVWRWADGMIERYRNGLEHGVWRFPDGTIASYRNGQKHGLWTWEDGTASLYRNGECVERFSLASSASR